ncbi:hypothetical protein EDB89DRAFT_1954194, partial [Lactarius sanguifluus]
MALAVANAPDSAFLSCTESPPPANPHGTQLRTPPSIKLVLIFLIIISSTVWFLVLSTLCGITFIAGPQAWPQAISFCSKPSSRCLFCGLVIFLLRSASIFIYSSQVADQDCHHQLLKIAHLSVFFPVYRLSNVSSTTHCMLSHLALAFSLLDSVQI